MSTSFRRAAVGILFVLTFSILGDRASWAAVVDPTRNNTATLSGTTVAGRPELLGMVLADSTQPFEIKNAARDPVGAGTLRQQVVRENASQTLDFYYQLTNTSSSHALGSVLVFGLLPGKLDLDFLSDAPANAARPTSASVLGLGGSIASFDFNAGIAPGQTSAPLFVHTRSSAFVTDASGTAIVFGNRLPGDSDLENLQSPVLSIARPVATPIPLPPALFASGAILLPMGAIFVWRKRSAEKLENV